MIFSVQGQTHKIRKKEFNSRISLKSETIFFGKQCEENAKRKQTLGEKILKRPISQRTQPNYAESS